MKIRNIVMLLLVMIIFSNCQYSNTEEASKCDIEKIIIKAVDFSIMTPISIDCDNYEVSFDQQFRIFSITDSITVNRFLKTINNLEVIDSTFSKSVDTRVKVVLYSQRDTSLICIGNLTLTLNNRSDVYKTPQSLIEFVENLMFK